MTQSFQSVTSETKFVELADRRLAYRTIGSGKPLVLAVRFRGTMDSWDPLFLDALAAQGFQVTVFDYTGLGQSTGTPTYNPASLAKDAIELISALQLRDVAMGGWSLGGIAAQIVLAQAPALVSHVVLMATTPPGHLVKSSEQLFYDLARRQNDADDAIRLFFEPGAPASVNAGHRSLARLALRTTGSSPDVPHEWAAEQLGGAPRNPMFPVDAVLHVLKNTAVPVLHLGADHDIAFPVENWYALNAQLPTLCLVTFPSAGHAPQHQYPHEAARHIAAFVLSEHA
ncbi:MULTISPECIES: alpha/beta hydrolase [Rhodanobacteraceae]|uniref:alpha/beta fold hydrolase n=1 Tax=Rhodanobacteraceae TaxID=1775411 RepID=UPI00088CEE92|nr:MULTISPECIES: alpha/beta hydrolase [Rhodanobacteraceae]SDF41190.1 Pimeloyl-ACP methyl ester carboxylesterase [Dyella sp. 333MFSha]SKB27542.1 Pimeloyl-ACP methyl ester carboxylesterase [Luteibacter sp. 22Crub2.1]